MSRKDATKAVKTLSKKSNKFLAFLVVVLLITNSMTLYLLLGDVELPFLDSSITSQPSTSSSSTTQTVIEDRTLMLSNDTCSELRVHYLDILKIGDAIAIECGDIDIIDAGEKEMELMLLPHFRINSS